MAFKYVVRKGSKAAKRPGKSLKAVGTPPPAGQGGRFKALKAGLAKKGAKNPGALAAYIGRKKYGKAKFQKMSAKGK